VHAPEDDDTPGIYQTVAQKILTQQHIFIYSLLLLAGIESGCICQKRMHSRDLKQIVAK
jgi:hypothetical protein